MVHRGITLRVRPGSKAKHDKMMRVAGACRKVWNEVLEICERQYQEFKAGKADKPSVTFFTLCKLYVQVKQELPWLGELSSNPVRYTVKHLAEAYKRFFAGAGRPVWKRKFKDNPRFTVPDNIKIKGKKIYIPKIGWVRLTGKNPYTDGKPKLPVLPTGSCYVGFVPLAGCCQTTAVTSRPFREPPRQIPTGAWGQKMQFRIWLPTAIRCDRAGARYSFTVHELSPALRQCRG